MPLSPNISAFITFAIPSEPLGLSPQRPFSEILFSSLGKIVVFLGNVSALDLQAQAPLCTVKGAQQFAMKYHCQSGRSFAAVGFDR